MAHVDESLLSIWSLRNHIAQLFLSDSQRLRLCGGTILKGIRYAWYEVQYVSCVGHHKIPSGQC